MAAAALRAIEQHFEEAIACVCLSVVAICVFTQVVARYGFDTALHWTEEVAAIAMVWGVYMGASLCVRERFHIRIMAGVVALPVALGRAITVVADLIWLVFNVIMIRVGIDYLVVLWQHPAIMPALRINQLYPHSIVVIGYVLMTLRLIQLYYRWVRDGGRGIPGLRAEYGASAEL